MNESSLAVLDLLIKYLVQYRSRSLRDCLADREKNQNNRVNQSEILGA